MWIVIFQNLECLYGIDWQTVHEVVHHLPFLHDVAHTFLSLSKVGAHLRYQVTDFTLVTVDGSVTLKNCTGRFEISIAALVSQCTKWSYANKITPMYPFHKVGKEVAKGITRCLP